MALHPPADRRCAQPAADDTPTDESDREIAIVDGSVDTVYLPSGSNARLLLRYSPACRTVWAHVIGAAVKVAGNNAGGSARIHRNWDNVGLDCVSPVGGTGCYTNMLYDGGTTSHAHGWNDTGVRIYSGTTVNY